MANLSHAPQPEHERDDEHDHGHEHDAPHDHAAGGSGNDEQRSGRQGRGERGHGHSHAPSSHVVGSGGDGLRVVAIATAGMFVVAAIEFAFFAASQSAGLLSDVLHNLGDVLTTVALWLAFLVARRPPTRRFTYGFSRAEDLAGAFIALVITVSAAAAGFESYRRLVSHIAPTHIGLGIIGAVVGFVGNEALAQYKLRMGRRLNSAPLIADGQHSRADGLTSLAAAAGLVLTGLGVGIADPIAGLVIAIAILYILVDVGREVFRRLLDAVDPEVIDDVRAQALAVPGVQQVDDLRARWAGRRLYIALNVGADGTLTLMEAHTIAERVRQEVLSHVAGAAIVDVHVDPVGLPEGIDAHAWLHDTSHHDHSHEHGHV